MEQVILQYRPRDYPGLESAVLSALESGAARVVLDLDAVDVLDTQALRGLISLLRRVRAAGGELALRSARADVLRTLSVTALDRVFPIVAAQAA